MEQLVIFGTGDIAEIAHYYLENDERYNVAAFTVDREFLKESEYKGLPVVPFEELVEKYPPGEYKLFIALSYNRVNKLRAEKYEAGKALGYQFITYISPRATIYDNVTVGENCFIFEDNTIQPFVKIGNNVTLWSGNHIGHHSTIGDHCFISSHVVVSGGVKVEPYCFVGVNATFRDHITVARECVIGAGAVIMSDTEERGVYFTDHTEKARVTSDRLRKI